MQKENKNIESNPSLGWKMLIVGGGITIISLFFNVQFGSSLGSDSTSSFSMGAFYLLADLAKLIVLVIAGFALRHRHFWQAGIFIIIFLFTVTFSLISTQSYMATLIDSEQLKKLSESDAYKDHKNAKSRTQSRVESLAISRADINDAKNMVERLSRERNAAQKNYDENAAKKYYTTATNKAAAKLSSIEKELEKHQKLVEQGRAYAGAITNLERLENKNIKATSQGTENAGFLSVSRALGVNVNSFISYLLFAMSLMAEITTTTFFAYVGWVFGDRRRTFSHVEIMQMQMQLHQQAKQETEIKNLYDHNQGKKEIEKNDKIDPEDIETALLPAATIKKTIGSVYTCAENGCTKDFKARTVWHKFCPDCRANKDRKMIDKVAKKV